LLNSMTTEYLCNWWRFPLQFHDCTWAWAIYLLKQSAPIRKLLSNSLTWILRFTTTYMLDGGCFWSCFWDTQAKTCKALSTLALEYLYADENKILYFKRLSLTKRHQWCDGSVAITSKLHHVQQQKCEDPHCKLSYSNFYIYNTSAQRITSTKI
jgi:hypothetical protein